MSPHGPGAAGLQVASEVEHEEQDAEGQGRFKRPLDETPDPADQAAKGEVAHDDDADDAEGHRWHHSDRRLKRNIRPL